MHLVDNLTEKEYNDFCNKNPYFHFLQSYKWGLSCLIRNQTPVLLGLKDENGLIHAACMALRKDIFNHTTYFYAPRGIIIDYNNKELLKIWTEELKKYLKEKNAVYFRMDPAIIYQQIDENAMPINEGNNNYELYDYLLSLGYYHHGFTKLYTLNQPRYTFRIDTLKDIKDIENAMNKTYLKTIKRSYNYDLQITNEYDTETFYSLMKNIANKDGFNGNPKEFYEGFSKNFTKEEDVHYISIKINPSKELHKAKTNLAALKQDLKDGKIIQKHMADTQNLIARYEKDIEFFEPYAQKYDDYYTCLTLICPFTKDAMWTVYIGNDSLATYTFAVNRAYYEAIVYAHNKGLKFLDLYGTCGDPNSKEKNYAALHEYKRKSGGTYTEFIGQFDLINKPFYFKHLPALLKIYRSIKK